VSRGVQVFAIRERVNKCPATPTCGPGSAAGQGAEAEPMEESLSGGLR